MAGDRVAKELGAAAIFVAQRFKGPTTLREGTTVVGLTPTSVLSNDPERLSWLIVNPGVNDGALGFSREITALAGIPVAGAGGVVSANVIEDAELITRAVFGIQDILGSTWYHVEVLRVSAADGEET